MNRVVFAPNWIGDTVMSLPFLRALRRAHPQDRLSVLARRGPAAIYRAEASADDVRERSTFAGDVQTLRRGGFGEAWLLPNSFRAAVTAFCAAVPRRIGYATDRRGWLLTDALPPPRPGGHQLRDYDALLQAHRIAPDLEPPRFPIPPAAAERAAQALAAARIPPDAALLLLSPASAVASTKRWPPERYAALADRLAGSGFRCAVVVGPSEESVAARVTSAARTALPVLGLDLDPVELAALLSRARLLVSNDSGPMHLAAAVGTPVVAFFGPTDPGRTAPSGSPSRVLDRYVFCSPCFLDSCPYGHECMRELSVEAAVGAVGELVATL